MNSKFFNDIKHIYNAPFSAEAKINYIGRLIADHQLGMDHESLINNLYKLKSIVEKHIVVGTTEVHPWRYEDPGITGWTVPVIATHHIQKDYIQQMQNWIFDIYHHKDSIENHTIMVYRPNPRYHEAAACKLIETILTDYLNACGVKWEFKN